MKVAVSIDTDPSFSISVQRLMVVPLDQNKLQCYLKANPSKIDEIASAQITKMFTSKCSICSVNNEGLAKSIQDLEIRTRRIKRV